MKLHAIFIGANGIAHMEPIPLRARVIEFPDGDHAISPSKTYHDANGINPPVLIYWHGLAEPEGSKTFTDLERLVTKEARFSVMNRQKVRISRRWVRLLIRGIKMGFKTIAICFVLGVMMLVILGLMI